MIEQAMGWIEIYSVPEFRADLVANQVEVSWYTRYASTNSIIVDRGKELLSVLKSMMANDYGISCNSINTTNP